MFNTFLILVYDHTCPALGPEPPDTERAKTPYAEHFISIVDINTESQYIYIIINQIYKILKQPEYRTMLGHISVMCFKIL